MEVDEQPEEQADAEHSFESVFTKRGERLIIASVILWLTKATVLRMLTEMHSNTLVFFIGTVYAYLPIPVFIGGLIYMALGARRGESQEEYEISGF